MRSVRFWFAATTQAFLISPIRLARMSGDPWNFWVNSWSVFISRISLRSSSSPAIGLMKSGSVVCLALKLCGQTSWHRSQPNIQSLIWGRSSSGIGPLFSIVRYEMHLRASIE